MSLDRRLFLRQGEDAERAPLVIEERRLAPSGQLAEATCACQRCDAPVALSAPARPGDPLVCPFCQHRAPVRDFISLSAPARPARVVVSVRTPSRRDARPRRLRMR